MNDINKVRLQGVLARDPKSGQGERGRYAFATLVTKEKKSSQYHDIAAFEKDVVDVLSGMRKGDRLEVTGQLTYRKVNDAYKASVIVDDCYEPGGPQETTITDDSDLPF